MFQFILNYLEIYTNKFLSLGYLGIFLLMVLESSFIPFPSEIVLIPAGILVYEGKLNVLLVIFFAVLGSLFGAIINYYIAYFLGRKIIFNLTKNYGKFFLIEQKSIEKTENFFKKYGSITTFFGRLIPVIRQLISLPAGYGKMDFKKFCLFTILGAGLWDIILILLGYYFQKNVSLINKNIDILTLIFLIIVLLIIIFYIIKNKKNKLFKV